MRIQIEGKDLVNTVQFMNAVPTKAGEFQAKIVRAEEGKAEMPKLSLDGRQIYKTTVMALKIDETTGQPSGQEQNVTLGVIEQTDLGLGKLYRTDGLTWVTHYQTDARRIGVSIVTERLVPVETSKAPSFNNKPSEG